MDVGNSLVGNNSITKSTMMNPPGNFQGEMTVHTTQKEISASVVTSNLHEATLCYFEKNSFKVRKQKGKLDILLFPVVLVPSKLDI